MSEIFNYTGFKEPMDSSELLRQIRNQELNDLKANPTFLAQIGGLNFLGDSLGKLSDYFLAGTEDDINVNDVQKDIYGSTWGDIFTQGDRRNSILSSINSNVVDYADVKNNSNLGTLWDSNDYQAGVNTLGTGEQIGAVSSGVLSGAAKWAATAASINPTLAPYAAIAGGLVDGTKSLINVLQGNKTAEIANNAIDRANSTQFNNYVNQARTNRNAMYRSFAEGGPLESENGVEFFNVGGTHESNPYGGIFQGTAEDGSPNLVEEGEVLYNDYVFSRRLKANGGLLKRYVLPEDYAGMSFADIAKKVQEDSEQRPYDPVSKNYLDDVMTKLQAAQEEVRAKKASKETKAFDEFNNMFAGGGPFNGKFSRKGKPAVRQGVEDTRRLANQIRNSRYLHTPPPSADAVSYVNRVNPAMNYVKDAQTLAANSQIPQETLTLLDPRNQRWLLPRNTNALPILKGIKAFAGRTAADAILYSTTIAPLIAAIQRYNTDRSNYNNTQRLNALDEAFENSRRALEEQGYNAVEATDIIFSELGNQGYTSFGRQEIPEEYINYDAVNNRSNNQTAVAVKEDSKKSTNAFEVAFLGAPPKPGEAPNAKKDRDRFNRFIQRAVKSSYEGATVNEIKAEEKAAKAASTANSPNNTVKKAATSTPINVKSTGTKSYTVTKDGKSYTVRANSPEEAKRTVRIYLSNNSNNPTDSGSSYESTRTSVRVKEKGRVPGNRRSNASTTTAPRTPVTVEPLIPADNNTHKETPVTPVANTVNIPDLEPEYDETNTDTNPSPRYRRSPLATAAMLAPAIGNIGQAFTDALGITNRPDYYVEQGIRRNASNLNPIAPKLNTDYQEYRPYDVNVMNNQLLAQEYAAQKAARENLNPHTQAAQLLALNNAFGNVGYMANLQAQQANDAKRNATLQWNHGINKENAATVAAYDEINQGIKQQRLNMLNQALQAKDASDTARAQVISANRSAALTDLGSVGRYINDTGLTNALIKSGVFGPLNSDMSDIYKNLQILNLSR